MEMLKTNLFLIVYLLTIFVGNSATGSISSNDVEDPPIINRYIWRSCKITNYQRLCYASLISYATYIDEDPIHLAIAAINATRCRLFQINNNFLAINHKIVTNTSAVELRTARAMVDCLDLVGIALDLLYQSEEEIEALVDAKEIVKSQLQNAQVWVGAALTNQDTCIDGFTTDFGDRPDSSLLGKRIKTFVISRMNTTERYTSNVLVLVNSLVRR